MGEEFNRWDEEINTHLSAFPWDGPHRPASPLDPVFNSPKMSLLTTLSMILALTPLSLANPNGYGPVQNTAGFNSPSISQSAGGKAICISGTIPVTATAQNEKILLPPPANQSVITETFVQYLSINSTTAEQVNGGDTTVSGTYKISAKLCYPNGYSTTGGNKTLQFLIHGIGFDKSYWDFTPGYSYVDDAADAGYPTFLYDRLGVGLSDHPDPIQVVQAPLQVEIAHQLIQSLRSGAFGNTKWSKIVGVGHSFGSIQTNGLTVKYPKDLGRRGIDGVCGRRGEWAGADVCGFHEYDCEGAGAGAVWRAAEWVFGFWESSCESILVFPSAGV